MEEWSGEVTRSNEEGRVRRTSAGRGNNRSREGGDASAARDSQLHALRRWVERSQRKRGGEVEKPVSCTNHNPVEWTEGQAHARSDVIEVIAADPAADAVDTGKTRGVVCRIKNNRATRLRRFKRTEDVIAGADLQPQALEDIYSIRQIGRVLPLPIRGSCREACDASLSRRSREEASERIAL